MYRANQRNQFFKPENALQRAEELLEVNAPLDALNVLSEPLLSRRARSAPATSLEPLITRFLTLAVTYRRFSLAREALHNFKNLALTTSVPSIERVVRHFLDFSEQRLNEVVDETSDVCAIGDLDSLDTLESHFLNIISLLEESEDTAESLPLSMTTKERADQIFAMRLKYLWDAYRLVLELLRNNSKLETLYQQTAAAAFAFCVRYKRKVEFRRLCETLRSHVTGVRRTTNSPVAINMSDPDVLQRFLDTRFLQMQTASDLEMWQESFRSAEDIYELLVFAAEKICYANNLDHSYCEDLLPVALISNKLHGQRMMQMLVQYYEKLTKVFAKSEDAFFLAAAWSKYYAWYFRLVKEELASETELCSIANNYILAALASPVFADDKVSDFSTRFNRKDRLTKMLGWSGATNRQALLTDPNFRLAMSQASPLVQDVFLAIEVEFHPLTSAKNVRQVLLDLSKSDLGVSSYVPMLRNATIIKTLRQVSTFYSAVSFDALQAMTSVGSEDLMPLFVLEKIIILGNQKGNFTIRIDHVNRRFVLRATTAKSNLFDIFRVQVAQPNFHDTLHKVFAAARISMAAEHTRNLKRQEIIESFKIKPEEPAEVIIPEVIVPVKIDRASEETLALKAKLEAETLASKRAALEKEKRRINSLEARKNAEILRTKVGFIIKNEDLDKLSSSDVDYLYSQHIKYDRAQLNERVEKFAERSDYLERANRHHETPLLKKAAIDQAVRDKNLIIDTRKRLVAQSMEKHANDVKLMNRVAKMQHEAIKYRDKFSEMYHEEIEREDKANKEALRVERIGRRNLVRDLLLQKRKEAEAEARRRAEMERQEEQRKAREAAEQERKRIEEEEQKRKANTYVPPHLRPAQGIQFNESDSTLYNRAPVAASSSSAEDWFTKRKKTDTQPAQPARGDESSTSVAPREEESIRRKDPVPTPQNFVRGPPRSGFAPSLNAEVRGDNEKPQGEVSRGFSRDLIGSKLPKTKSDNQWRNRN